MTTITTASDPASLGRLDGLPSGGTRVYAIALDMDVESLRMNYGDPYNNAYGQIRPSWSATASHGSREAFTSAGPT